MIIKVSIYSQDSIMKPDLLRVTSENKLIGIIWNGEVLTDATKVTLYEEQSESKLRHKADFFCSKDEFKKLANLL